MNDAELIRWAADLCGWDPTYDGGQMIRICNKMQSGFIVGTGIGGGVLKALMADLLAKFVEATPEPDQQSSAPFHDRNKEIWSWWAKQDRAVRAAIPQGPMAVIRAIYDAGVLQ